MTAASIDSRMLVLPGSGGGALAAFLASSYLDIAERSVCPAVIWHGRAGQVPDRRAVVVGIDGSELSDAAVLGAFELAQLWQAPVHAVRVWSVHHEVGDVTVEYLVDRDALARDAHRLLEQRLSFARRRFPEVPTTEAVVEGAPVHVLRASAEGAQLIVVGSHGRGRIAGALYGSVSRALAHHCPCPVLICRTPHRDHRP
ncbi:universal stress protein [Rhodococcus zopfii]|uniref:universal stress protein n=1 Tax=Rhodococcus zopfii TaxID=43772 RepID=UPI001472C2DD|nr:universal stress protein [Rhodococcus zopfii]